MGWIKWIPWQGAARRVARRHGFIDPIQFLARLRQFARPSEVGEPIELLRAGVVFHARGLINRAIQFNLDWVWPYWIERQFNPEDDSFVPRAFSFSHINLTHRNWTAVGLPNCDLYPIVDPRGLVTPHHDGWSLDFWLVNERGEILLLPSKMAEATQELETLPDLQVVTAVRTEAHCLRTIVSVHLIEEVPTCVVRLQGESAAGAKLVVSARPCNPEGISFIDSIQFNDRRLVINAQQSVEFSVAPERCVMSCYEMGDVFSALSGTGRHDSIRCPAGMATAAALFPIGTQLEIRIPLARPAPGTAVEVAGSSNHLTWSEEIGSCAGLTIPNERYQRLYNSAVATLILHTPHEVYPGPYTYKRFWYRDAAFILNALIELGCHARVRKALDHFPKGQTADGYFRSQEGEWDANGEVLWVLDRYFHATGQSVPKEWIDMIERGARWIVGKRLPIGSAHPGLFPAGFSAEHLGPNDYYYWDDFWGVAGLRSAARLLEKSRPQAAAEFRKTADEFLSTIESSLPLQRTSGAMPAAPDRRMDSGAVGSLVADYPLQLLAPGDPRVLKTVNWLLEHSYSRGGFFQNMIHSGVNAYLTLQMAQVLWRAGDARADGLIAATADLASPTGQWPEAIHPRTLGGCMGDGQHAWAAAEWVMMMHSRYDAAPRER